MTQEYEIDTLLAQAGNRTDARTGAVSTPISFPRLMGIMASVKVPDLITQERKTRPAVY